MRYLLCLCLMGTACQTPTAPAPVAGRQAKDLPHPYTNDLSGVCQKLVDCGCSDTYFVQQCMTTLGVPEMRDAWVPSTVSCVTSANCEDICKNKAVERCVEKWTATHTVKAMAPPPAPPTPIPPACPEGKYEVKDIEGHFIRCE